MSKSKTPKPGVTKRRCDFCARLKAGVKRKRLFDNEDDAMVGLRGSYRYLCRKCEQEKVAHP